MKLVVYLTLLFCGLCLASEGQGIDEEKIYPDWDDDTFDKIVNYPCHSKHKKPSAAPAAPVKPDERIIKLNKGVDTVLGFVKDLFAQFGEVSIPLPDISKPFGKPPYGGIFKATRGYFKDPASLQRTGNVEIIIQSSTTATLQVQLGFKVAEAGFEQFNLDILSIHNNGTISATVSENSLTMKLTLTYAPKCTFHLDELKFDKLSNIKVNITGLGVFQTLFDKLSFWLIANFESTFRDIINHKMYETVNKAIMKKNICKYFPQ